MRLALILILAVFLGLLGQNGAADAGAWPRGEGKFFFALSQDQTERQLYAEYGFRGDWTLGLEVTQPTGRRLPAVAGFVHHPVLRFKNGAIVSAGLAVEWRETVAAKSWAYMAGIQEVAVRGGLHFGTGFATRWGDGWATAEAQVERIVTENWLGAAQSAKLDLGLGLRPTDRLMLMVQAQGWRRQGSDPVLRLETLVGWKLGPAHLVLVPSAGMIGPREPRVKLGLWLEF